MNPCNDNILSMRVKWYLFVYVAKMVSYNPVRK